MKPTYVPLTDREKMVIGLLTVSQRLSGTLPTPAEFDASLQALGVARTEAFMATVARLFPAMGLRW
ncbi:hypothetical protein ACFQ44_05030 [Levilactobacillus lanxiensis]|uniref:Uncharacterized protein n=1 Tax=Levilactobacillus lanxiensis TaxID=2799568 RepID=A0ABW4D541_9LACO|nr:hypothetical protein [Levilactobacillus lanxiensis]